MFFFVFELSPVRYRRTDRQTDKQDPYCGLLRVRTTAKNVLHEPAWCLEAFCHLRNYSDWHELMIPQRIMRPSIACADELTVQHADIPPPQSATPPRKLICTHFPSCWG